MRKHQDNTVEDMEGLLNMTITPPWIDTQKKTITNPFAPPPPLAPVITPKKEEKKTETKTTTTKTTSSSNKKATNYLKSASEIISELAEKQAQERKASQVAVAPPPAQGTYTPSSQPTVSSEESMRRIMGDSDLLGYHPVNETIVDKTITPPQQPATYPGTGTSTPEQLIGSNTGQRTIQTPTGSIEYIGDVKVGGTSVEGGLGGGVTGGTRAGGAGTGGQRGGADTSPKAIAKAEEEYRLEKAHYLYMSDEPGLKPWQRPQYAYESPYQVKHGYNPAMQDVAVSSKYSQIESGIQSNIELSKRNIEISQQNIQLSEQASGMISGYDTQISQIRQDYKPGETISYTTGEKDTQGNLIYKSSTREDLIKSLEEDRQYLIELSSRKKEFEQDLISSQQGLKSTNTEYGTLMAYKELGYKVETTDEGYQFELPKSSEVYVWKHGEELSGVALTSASFIKSPLAVGSLFSAIQYGITKDESVRQAEFESLSEYALGLDESIRKGEYIQKVATSPAMVEGVYIPLATLGAGSLLGMGVSEATPYISRGVSSLTGIGSKFTPAGANLLSQASTIGKTAIKPFISAGRVGGMLTETVGGKMATNVVLFGAFEGKGLIEVATTRPEEFGSYLGERAFSFGMTIGALETGFKAGYKPNLSGNIPEIPGSVKQPKVEGKIDLFQKTTPEPGVMTYNAEGQVTSVVKGTKPMTYDVSAKGASQEVELIAGRPTSVQSQGRGIIKWTEQRGFTKYYRSKSVNIKGSGFEIGTSGEQRIVYSVEESAGIRGTSTGKLDFRTPTQKFFKSKKNQWTYTVEKPTATIEPTTGESLTSIKQLDKIQKYESEGTFSNVIDDVMGTTKTRGYIYTDDTIKPITDTAKPLADSGEKDTGLVRVIKDEKAYKTTERPPADWKLKKKKGAQYYIQETVQVKKPKPVYVYDVGGLLTKEVALLPTPVKPISESLITGAKTATLLTGSQLTEPEKRIKRTTDTFSLTSPGNIQREDMILKTKTLRGQTTATRGQTTATTGATTPETITITKTTELYETKQKQKPGEGTLNKPITGEISSYRFGEAEKQDYGLGTKFGTGLGTRSSQDMRQRLGVSTKQRQMLRTATPTETVTITTPGTTPRVPRILIPGIPRKKKKEEEEAELYKKPRKGRQLFRRTTKKRSKGLPPDILSVTQSQAQYGTATAPEETPSLFETSSKKLFLRTPTVELLKGGKKRTRYY